MTTLFGASVWFERSSAMKRVAMSAVPVWLGCELAAPAFARLVGEPRQREPASRSARNPSLARASSRYGLAFWLQIVAMAVLLVVSPRGEVLSARASTFGEAAFGGYAALCDAPSGDEGSTHRRRLPSQCCLFCPAAGRDLSVPFFDVSSNASHFSAPVASFHAVRPSVDEPSFRATGRARVLSARAPPHL
jgi:hypothetical protein